ncbi:MAG: outer membrane protein assembly factor BamE [Nitrospirota bacterium]
MKRIGTVFIAGGSLWLLALGLAHAEIWRSGHHSHRPLVHERQTSVVTGRAAGEVSFETLRMLSTGMTKAEVLSRAGSPRHEFKNRGTQRWVYASSDRWIVEIVFSGNNAIAVNWSRA